MRPKRERRYRWKRRLEICVQKGIYACFLYERGWKTVQGKTIDSDLRKTVGKTVGKQSVRTVFSKIVNQRCVNGKITVRKR